MDFLYTLAVIFGIFGVSILLINVRHLIKGESFRGTCANNNPILKNQIGECTVCGKKADEVCQMPEPGNALGSR